MPNLYSRIKEITTTTGSGTITLGGAVTGYRAFNSYIANGTTIRYVIDDYAGNWEEGNGIVGTGSVTRSPIESSNSNALVNFGAGNKYIYITAIVNDYLPDQSTAPNGILSTNGTAPVFNDKLVFDGTNLGVGTATPYNLVGYTTITVDGSLGSGIALNSNGVLKSGLYADNNGLSLVSGSNFIFGDGFFNEFMRLTDLGDLGIGTSTPTHVSGYTTLSVGGTKDGGIGALYSNNSPGIALSVSKGATILDDQPSVIGATSDGSVVLAVGYSNGQTLMGSPQYIPIYFVTNNIERARITKEGRVGIGTSTPSTKAILDVQSTSLGIKFPNMTTAQKNAIGNDPGLVVFDTTLGKLCVNNGSAWQTITSV